MIELVIGAAAGATVGALVVAIIAVWTVRRQIRRVRAAERRARAAERLAELGAMTGGLAHEIKNPLSTISLNAQLLAEAIADAPFDEADRARLRRRLDTLQREIERLRGILTDFLEYAGQIRLDRAPTDLNQLVTDLADFFLPQAEQHQVRLRMELAHRPLVAELDAKLVKQAALNLMLNAVQAMSHPRADQSDARLRELILRTRAATDPDGQPVVALHVIDTGPGIDPAIRDRIFEPYFTTKAGGTGLGLATARRIVQEHGGRIDVHSEPGKGTDFTMVLPVSA